MSLLKKVKKANGEILAVNELYEKKPNKIKNFGVFLRYYSRSGIHNMHKVKFRNSKTLLFVYLKYFILK